MNLSEQDLLDNMADIVKAGVRGLIWVDYMWAQQAYIAKDLSATYDPGGWSSGAAGGPGALAAYSHPQLVVSGTLVAYGADVASRREEPLAMTFVESFETGGLSVLVNGHAWDLTVQSGRQMAMRYELVGNLTTVHLLVEQPSWL